MRKLNLIKLLLILSVIITLIAGCDPDDIQDVPTANISSVLNILNDDTSDIVWHNQTSIKLDASPSFKGKGILINGTQIKITEGGNYTLTGTLANGSVIVDTPETVNLTLKNANITNTSGPAINIVNAHTAYITLISDTKNYLIDGTAYTDTSLNGAVTSHAPLIFQGNGALDITSQYKDAVFCSAPITISNGVFNLSSVKDGINTQQSLTINGGNISITHSTNAISSGDSIEFNNGVISASSSTNGAFAAKDITVKGSTLNISDCMNGIKSRSSIFINGGNLNLSTSAASLSADNAITINNGNLHLEADNTVVEASGCLTVNAGTTLILANDPAKASMACNSGVIINGGTFLAAGTIGSIPEYSMSMQPAVILDALSAHTLVHIQSDQQSVLTFTPQQDYDNLLFSSPLLQKNKFYTVFTGGSTHGGTDFYGLHLDSTYQGGTASYTFACNEIAGDTENPQ